jgi:hypothetical protein
MVFHDFSLFYEMIGAADRYYMVSRAASFVHRRR